MTLSALHRLLGDSSVFPLANTSRLSLLNELNGNVLNQAGDKHWQLMNNLTAIDAGGGERVFPDALITALVPLGHQDLDVLVDNVQFLRDLPAATGVIGALHQGVQNSRDILQVVVGSSGATPPVRGLKAFLEEMDSGRRRLASSLGVSSAGFRFAAKMFDTQKSAKMTSPAVAIFH